MDALEAAIREHLRLRDGEEPTEEQVRGLLEEESVLAPLDADRLAQATTIRLLRRFRPLPKLRRTAPASARSAVLQPARGS